ncbi:protein EARLY FLOWERING [Salix suchowensis]|nr:protein EARLY FLOWERING [Salix suchowensis]
MNTTLDSFSAAESNMEDPSNPTITTNQNTNKEDEVDDESVLDRNRVLIQQVNENHQSRIPDNMVKNVSLIQELNVNISKVVGLYSDLNSNFSTAYHQRNHNSKNNCKKA